MPTDLVNATADYRADLIDEKLWQTRIEARRDYAFRAKAKPDTEGHVRLMCPAAGTAPTAICPPEWASTYGTLRNTNGLVKDGSYEALADPTRRRVRGVAATSVLVAFGIYALNIRKIDTFERLAVVDDDGILRKPKKRRRSTKPVQHFAPTTSSGDPPPAA